MQANRTALSDIASRFLGVIKNGIEEYGKDTNTQQRNQVKESKLEGLALSTGEKAINKHMAVHCREITKNADGATYNVYVACATPIKEVIDDIVNELEVQKVDIDSELFRRKMLSQIESDKKRTADEIERNKAQLKELQGDL